METMHYMYMETAIEEAQRGENEGEVPIGAVLVANSGDILAVTHNKTIGLCDPSGHAEMLALREGAQRIANYRLVDTTLYVTIEPCVMCMGAIIHARIERLVYGAKDPKWGAAGSLFDFSKDSRFNHQVDVISGIRAETCSKLMTNFFRKKRKSIARNKYIP